MRARARARVFLSSCLFSLFSFHLSYRLFWRVAPLVHSYDCLHPAHPSPSPPIAYVFFSSSAAAARIMPTLLSYRAAAPRRICHTLHTSTYAPPSLVPSSLPLPLSPSHLMSSTTPRPAVHAYQYVSHPRRMLRPAPHDLALDLWRRRASFCLFFFLLFSSGGGS